MSRKRKFNELLVVATTALAVSAAVLDRGSPVPKNTSILTGKAFVRELLETDNEARFHEIARMDKQTFLKLLNLLIIEGNLRDSRKVSAEEKLMIFIQALKGLKFTTITDRYQHSGSTITNIIEQVANCLILLKDKFLIQPTANQPDSVRIANDPKFFPFFSSN
jgi:hypothetical protein